LTSRELALEYQQIQGQREQTWKRLAAVLSEKHRVSRDASDDTTALSRLTAQETELQQQLDGQERQLAILREQMDALVVRSPLDGRILTWKAEELLNGRPVRRGQALLSVARTEGPWELQVHVPDDQIGHVLRGRSRVEGKQQVSFILAAHPDQQLQGAVREISRTVTFVEDRRPVVLVSVDFDRDAVAVLRPGISVVAKIDCGRRSLGFVWFHRLMEAAYARLVF
jgi:multidrug efflux pump subunit AcrA (membrane-fusion protein)